MAAHCAYALHGEKRDRNQLDKLSGLSCFEKPALQAPVGAGLPLWFRRHFAVAM
jgi:hypothetical protein